MNEIKLPLEILKNNINKEIRLIMRKDKVFSGVLRTFDEHVNIFMENVYEILDDGSRMHIGSTIINGGNVAMIDLDITS
ncbi:hypothetical protein EDEG_02948, partial [Edhazardia aedis USNM 41457]